MITLKLWDIKDDIQEIKARYIPVDFVRPNPNHTRNFTDKRDMDALTRSIRTYGVLQPITVRRMRNNFYELVSGSRRLSAAKNAGLTEIPAIVVRATDRDSALMSLTENIQRQSLNFFEEARGYESLMKDYGLSFEEISRKTGKSRACISGRLKLLKLAPEVRRIIMNHGLTERHARALLRIPDEKIRFGVLIKIMEEDLSPSRTEAMAEEILNGMGSRIFSKDDDKKITRIVKDAKLYKNTILESVEIIKKWGVNAEYVVNETENLCEIKISIPLTC